MKKAHPESPAKSPVNSPVETPSGKDSGDENFPVGSFLLPKAVRPKVMLFYNYARAIDDIADNPDLSADEKFARLDGFDRALTEGTEDPAYAKASLIRNSMSDTGNVIRHCRDLIIAFKQDAVKTRYDDWDDLMGYCIHSAAPVGRFLLDVHGCDPSGYPASDALCNALQVINHLQDCQEDFRTLDRVYLPGDWMDKAGVTTDALDAPQASAGLRAVLDQCLDGTETLLDHARSLPGKLSSRRLAMESAAIIALASKLCRALRAKDPLAVRVELSKPRAAITASGGVLRYLLGGYRR